MIYQKKKLFPQDPETQTQDQDKTEQDQTRNES